MSLKAVVGGVQSLQSQNGPVTLESSDGSVIISVPTAGVINLQAVGGGGGGGGVSSVSVTTDNSGIIASVANPTTVPNISLALAYGAELSFSRF